MWFLILPQLRFGAGVIIGFYILLLIKFIGINDRLFSNKKIILGLAITSFIFFNIKNVNRINDEFKRLDKYQFKIYCLFQLLIMPRQNLLMKDVENL